MSSYIPLWCKSNFSFIEGASYPDELLEEACRFGLPALALTDPDGFYGIVRAHLKAREIGVSVRSNTGRSVDNLFFWLKTAGAARTSAGF
jgi:error-prone DNA polymerase